MQLVGEGFLGAGYNSMETGSDIYGRDSGLSPGYGAVVGFDFPFSELFSFGIRGGYTAHLNTYGGILLQAGTTISFPKITRRRRDSYQEQGPPPLLIEELRLNTVFPVFYKYYDNHALGSAILRNDGTVPLSDISIRLLVPRFMDVSKTQTIQKNLEPGEKENIDFFVLLNDEVLSITEGTKVALKIDVSFTADGRKQQYTMDRTLEMADRNAMTWDDDRKAASFVTAKDPAILTMARNVASVVRAEGYDAINLNLRTAIAMAEAVSLYGVNYVIDPTSPHPELAGSPQAVDFLQFPRQTLEYKAGDCDDLSILYSALLEAVGVPSAFITIPGHIYAAFSTGLQVDAAEKMFSRLDEFIIKDGSVWVPVEITMLGEGFLQAWQIGAKQWREHNSRGQAEFFPIAGAWQVFPPAGLPETAPRIQVPDTELMAKAYTTQLIRFIEREIFPQVSRLQTMIANSGNDRRYINSLGVLYGRYGLIERARAEFEKISGEPDPYPPSLLNLGNIYFLSGELSSALRYYDRALSLEPGNPVALLAVSRVNHELENYGLVAQHYSELKRVDPSLAGRFAYLDFRGEDARRAAQAADTTMLVIWDEDE
ncbi:MAG: tetratricopeptide repeat protein [Spirochaetales bacterium]|nr:tetratricopeptide repeat protein [Spirochaetales bacterium]